MSEHTEQELHAEASKSAVERHVSRALCWWLGCQPYVDEQGNFLGYDQFSEPTCKRCGDGVGYGDLVGDTRHNRFKGWCRYWFFRKWWPAKCKFCGRRWRDCDYTNGHIPF